MTTPEAPVDTICGQYEGIPNDLPAGPDYGLVSYV